MKINRQTGTRWDGLGLTRPSRPNLRARMCARSYQDATNFCSINIYRKKPSGLFSSVYDHPYFYHHENDHDHGDHHVQSVSQTYGRNAAASPVFCFSPRHRFFASLYPSDENSAPKAVCAIRGYSNSGIRTTPPRPPSVVHRSYVRNPGIDKQKLAIPTGP